MTPTLTVAELAEFIEAILPLLLLGSFLCSLLANVVYDLIGDVVRFIGRDKS